MVRRSKQTMTLEKLSEELEVLITYGKRAKCVPECFKWSCEVIASVLTKSPIPIPPDKILLINDIVKKKNEIVENIDFFNKILKSPPTLCGWHYRHNSLDDGRQSIITSSPIFDTSIGELKFDDHFSALQYHKNLLQVYFRIFGRINTFNEKIFELFLKRVPNTPALYAVMFACDNTDNQRIHIQEKKFPIKDSNSVIGQIIEISHSLEDSLMKKDGNDLRRKLLCEPGVEIKDIISKNDIRLWLRCLKKENWFSERKEALISTFYKIIHEDKVKTWVPVFKFMRFGVASETAEDSWSQQTALNLIESLNFLQGILLYKPFSLKWLGTFIPVPLEVNDELSAITLGFNKEPDDLNDFKMILCDAKNALNLLSSNAFVTSTAVKRKQDQTFEEKIGEHLYKKVISELYKLGFLPEMGMLLHYLLSIGNRLKNAIHEGQKLSFLIYFGKSTTLSHFHEIYTFEPQEQELTNISDEAGQKYFASLLKSHYSQLQHVARGIFVDMDQKASHRIVEPIMSDLYHQIAVSPYSKLKGTGFENRHDLCCWVTNEVPNLGAVVIGEGRVAIYLKEKQVLAWPNHDELKWWSPILNDSWNSQNVLINLLDKCNNPKSGEFRDDDIKLLANCCLQISARAKCGAMFLITKSKHMADINTMRVSMNPCKLSWIKESHIQDLDKDYLFDMAVQDGGTLIQINTGYVESQQHFVPIKHGKAYNYQESLDKSNDEDRATYGVRHATACDMSTVLGNKCVVVTISEDGPISVFYCGHRIAPNNIGSILLD